MGYGAPDANGSSYLLGLPVETVAHVRVEKGEILDLAEPMIIGLVKLDGADSLLTAKIQGIAPGACRQGLRVMAVWKDQPTGTVRDLDHFEVVS